MKRLVDAMATNKTLTEVLVDMGSASRKAKDKESRLVCQEKQVPVALFVELQLFLVILTLHRLA